MVSWFLESGWFQGWLNLVLLLEGVSCVFGTQIEEKRLFSYSSLIRTSNGQCSWLEPFEARLDQASPLVSIESCLSSNYPSSNLPKQTKTDADTRPLQPTKTSNKKKGSKRQKIPQHSWYIFFLLIDKVLKSDRQWNAIGPWIVSSSSSRSMTQLSVARFFLGGGSGLSKTFDVFFQVRIVWNIGGAICFFFWWICCTSRIQGKTQRKNRQTSSYSTRKHTFEFEKVRFFSRFFPSTYRDSDISTSWTPLSFKTKSPIRKKRANLLQRSEKKLHPLDHNKIVKNPREVGNKISSVFSPPRCCAAGVDLKSLEKIKFRHFIRVSYESTDLKQTKILEKSWESGVKWSDLFWKKNKNSTPKTHQVDAVGPGWEDDFFHWLDSFLGNSSLWKCINEPIPCISSQACIVHLREIEQLTPVEKITGYWASLTNHQSPEFLFEVNNFRNLLSSCPIGHVNVLVFGWKKWLYSPN